MLSFVCWSLPLQLRMLKARCGGLAFDSDAVVRAKA